MLHILFVFQYCQEFLCSSMLDFGHTFFFLHIRTSFLCLKNAVLETQPGFLSLFAHQSTIPQDPAKTCSSKSKGHQSTVHLAHFTHNLKLHYLIVPAGKAAIHCQIPSQVFLVCNKVGKSISYRWLILVSPDCSSGKPSNYWLQHTSYILCPTTPLYSQQYRVLQLRKDT